jgi:creatinine amidohydrolase
MLTPDNTAFEVADARPETALLGIGSVEQHSLHLPVDTDYAIAKAAAPRIAEALGAFALHALPYSVCLEHHGFPATVILKPLTLRAMVYDIAESLGLWGVRRLVLVNFHGGNFILNPAAREWNMDGKSPAIIPVDFYGGLSDMGRNLHSCEVETSIMLHLCPERVHMDRARDFVPDCAREDLTWLGFRRVTPTGVWGYPTRATAEKGKRWLEEGVAKSAAKARAAIAALA